MEQERVVRFKSYQKNATTRRRLVLVSLILQTLYISLVLIEDYNQLTSDANIASGKVTEVELPWLNANTPQFNKVKKALSRGDCNNSRRTNKVSKYQQK